MTNERERKNASVQHMLQVAVSYRGTHRCVSGDRERKHAAPEARADTSATSGRRWPSDPGLTDRGAAIARACRCGGQRASGYPLSVARSPRGPTRRRATGGGAPCTCGRRRRRAGRWGSAASRAPEEAAEVCLVAVRDVGELPRDRGVVRRHDPRRGRPHAPGTAVVVHTGRHARVRRVVGPRRGRQGRLGRLV